MIDRPESASRVSSAHRHPSGPRSGKTASSARPAHAPAPDPGPGSRPRHAAGFCASVTSSKMLRFFRHRPVPPVSRPDLSRGPAPFKRPRQPARPFILANTTPGVSRACDGGRAPSFCEDFSTPHDDRPSLDRTAPRQTVPPPSLTKGRDASRCAAHPPSEIAALAPRPSAPFCRMIPVQRLHVGPRQAAGAPPPRSGAGCGRPWAFSALSAGKKNPASSPAAPPCDRPRPPPPPPWRTPSAPVPSPRAACHRPTGGTRRPHSSTALREVQRGGNRGFTGTEMIAVRLRAIVVVFPAPARSGPNKTRPPGPPGPGSRAPAAWRARASRPAMVIPRGPRRGGEDIGAIRDRPRDILVQPRMVHNSPRPRGQPRRAVFRSASRLRGARPPASPRPAPKFHIARAAAPMFFSPICGRNEGWKAGLGMSKRFRSWRCRYLRPRAPRASAPLPP